MSNPLKVLIITSTLDQNSGGWGTYSSGLVSALKDKNVAVSVALIEHPLAFKRHFLLAFWEAWRLFRRYRRERFDLIHCVVEPYALTTAIFARLANTKYALTLHGTYAILFLANPVYGFFQKIVYRRASNIIAVSEYTKRRISGFMGLDNIAVIPNGFHYEPRHVAKKKKEEFVILSVGGIKERKGYHVVIEALAIMRESLGNFTYYLVGGEHDEAYGNRLRTLAQSKGLESNVVITGSVSAEKKKELYEEADLFVLTALSGGPYFEGFGLVYLEAGAYGIPVIGSKGSGAEEAVKEGETGLLVPQHDPQALAEAILKLKEDEELRHHMAERGVAWAQDHDWNRVVEKYLQEYASII